VTIPPEVVRILASSTVFVNASRRVNLDLAGMVSQIEGLGTQGWGRMLGRKDKQMSLVLNRTGQDYTEPIG